MKDLLDAFWRAAAYCLHPRVILWSALPLVLVGGAVLALGWLYWEVAVGAVRATLEQWALVAGFLAWLDSAGLSGFRAVLAPMIVVALAVPVVVFASLLLVAWLMTPAMVRLVVARRFPSLQARSGTGFLGTMLWSLGCTVVALLLLVLSLPLWLVPPLVLVLPPLIWGWLTYQVMSVDVLAAHASRDERRRILAEHRWPLLAIGVCTGYLGAAPSLLWAAGALTLVFAPILLVVSVWLYTLVFAFAALWFAHYALAALQRLRAAEAPPPEVPAPMVEPPQMPAAPLPAPGGTGEARE
jgi:hypothetical protein